MLLLLFKLVMLLLLLFKLVMLLLLFKLVMLLLLLFKLVMLLLLLLFRFQRLLMSLVFWHKRLLLVRISKIPPPSTKDPFQALKTLFKPQNTSKELVLLLISVFIFFIKFFSHFSKIFFFRHSKLVATGVLIIFHICFLIVFFQNFQKLKKILSENCFFIFFNPISAPILFYTSSFVKSFCSLLFCDGVPFASFLFLSFLFASFFFFQY